MAAAVTPARSRTGPGLAVPMEPVPPRLAALLRPELPSLCDEILAEVCAAVPEFAGPVRGVLAADVRDTVRQAMRVFVDGIAAPATCTRARDDMCRALGRRQIGFDTGLTRLDTAFRVGVRVCWRRIVVVAQRYEVPAAVQSSMADLLFGYVDELAAVAREGYLEAQRSSGDERARHRRRLARVLLDSRPDATALAQAARAAAWPVPERVVAVAVDSLGDVGDVLPDDVLVAAYGAPGVLLVPGAPSREALAELAGTLAGTVGTVRAAVGPAVPPPDARHSVRWAKRALALADRAALDPPADRAPGAVPGDGPEVVHVGDHLLALWLTGDPLLARVTAEIALAPLDALGESQRERLVDTLRSWLVHRGNVAQVAADLGIHPQTVRYRVRSLEATLGSVLDDPQWRLSTELALRAEQLRRGRPAR